MKKILVLTALVALSVSAFAQEKPANDEAPVAQQKAEKSNKMSAVWPAYFAIAQWPRAVDVVGLRITIPFSTSQESVTGVDLGFWGKSIYFEGIQLNLLRNNVIDSAAGFQVGLYNSIGRGDMVGLQVGLWNEVMSLRGVQVGLINVAGDAQGFQVGIVNRCEAMEGGYQIGLINIIRSAELQFCPIINIGF